MFLRGESRSCRDSAWKRPLPFTSHQELEVFQSWPAVHFHSWVLSWGLARSHCCSPSEKTLGVSLTLWKHQLRDINMNKVITVSNAQGRNNKNVLRLQEENQLRHWKIFWRPGTGRHQNLFSGEAADFHGLGYQSWEAGEAGEGPDTFLRSPP